MDAELRHAVDPVEWKVRIGHAADMEAVLTRALDDHLCAAHVTAARVGLTSEPYRCWNEAYADRGWDRMTLIYETADEAAARQAETFLAAHLRHYATAEVAARPKRPDGGGPGPAGGPAYVYIAVRGD